MDGILISSIGSVERSWTRWAAERGLDPALARRVAHGRRAIDTLAALCPELDAEAELKVLEDYEIEDNEGLTVLPGVLELLAALPADRWTVVTSATERLAPLRPEPVPASLRRFSSFAGDAEIAKGRVTLRHAEAMEGWRRRPVDAEITLGEPPKVAFAAPKEIAAAKPQNSRPVQ